MVIGIFVSNFYFHPQIPVFLSKNLLQKLYVFQYPLRSVAVETEKPNVVAVSYFLKTFHFLRHISIDYIFKARIKPKLQEIELELELSTKTPNYDKSKGEQICINADGPDKNDKPDHQNFFKGWVSL